MKQQVYRLDSNWKQALDSQKMRSTRYVGNSNMSNLGANFLMQRTNSKIPSQPTDFNMYMDHQGGRQF